VNAIFGSIAAALTASRKRTEHRECGGQGWTLCSPFASEGTMKGLMTALRHLASDTEGQDLLEYALLAALIAVVAIAGVTSVGNAIYNVFWSGIGQAI
jgi:Flp pilus assembly pilin Flp